MTEILLIEPFYGGSHKVLIDILKAELENRSSFTNICLITMRAKKWHWRARTSSLYLSEAIPKGHVYRVLFCSSVVNLAELVALRPDLATCKKIVYFHENQLVYPVRHRKDRDFQYGYNETLTCLVADLVIFNSQFNLKSFLTRLRSHFLLQPDYRPKNLMEKIAAKSKVLYFPVSQENLNSQKDYSQPLHIVWPHRWEHDKGLDEFIQILRRLKTEKVDFEVSVLGDQADVQNKFEEVKAELGSHVKHWGFLQSIAEFRSVLAKAHVAVSTAHHEFFGVSMMESVMAGCYPLCPNRLVYQELYPVECLYNTLDVLFDRLVEFANHKDALQERTLNLNIDCSKYSVDLLLPKYMDLFVA